MYNRDSNCIQIKHTHREMHWLPLFGGDHSTQNCVQGLDEVVWQVVFPQGMGDKIVVYGSECIRQVQTAYSDVALASSCIEDGLPQLELVFCALRNTFSEGFLCGCVNVVVTGLEAHDMFLEDAGAQLPDTGRQGCWSET